MNGRQPRSQIEFWFQPQNRSRRHQTGPVIRDHGVEAGSTIDFHIPSAFAEAALYYSHQFGTFICNPNYRIRREGMDCYLLCYVVEGRLFVQTADLQGCALAGQVVCLDCTQPHQYFAAEPRTVFMWFHFAGGGSRTYCALLNERNGLIIQPQQRADAVRRQFETLVQPNGRTLVDEHTVSVQIHRLLALLAEPSDDGGVDLTGAHGIGAALEWMQEHFMEPIRLETLADRAHLSPYHFIRVFKRSTNCTPHEYLLRIRIRHAKRLLQMTRLSNEAVADACGFSSGSHFARAFRAQTGLSPGAFKKERF